MVLVALSPTKYSPTKLHFPNQDRRKNEAFTLSATLSISRVATDSEDRTVFYLSPKFWHLSVMHLNLGK